MGDGFIEILDESFEFPDQVGFRAKAAAPHHPAVDDAEYNFDLIEPRTMFRKVHESNAMTGVRKKRPPRTENGTCEYVLAYHEREKKNDPACADI
ncbi:MAG: hypothetical protein WD065_19195 [Planctomycetaceae bacterium]